jgi:hypothetical protein
MFDNPCIDSQVGSNFDATRPIPRPVEDYFKDKDRVEREFREKLSKLPAWRRRLIKTALDGGW